MVSEVCDQFFTHMHIEIPEESEIKVPDEITKLKKEFEDREAKLKKEFEDREVKLNEEFSERETKREVKLMSEMSEHFMNSSNERDELKNTIKKLEAEIMNAAQPMKTQIEKNPTELPVAVQVNTQVEVQVAAQDKIQEAAQIEVQLAAPDE